MFAFNDNVSKDAINERLTHYQIFRYYSPQLDYGKVVISPLRKEANPSFGLVQGRSGDAIYNDLASQDSGDVFLYVGKLFGLTFVEVLHKINIDFGLKLMPTTSTKPLVYTKGIILQEETSIFKHVIDVIPREWNKADIEYWSKFGLTLAEVYASSTYPISAYRVDNGITILTDELAYCMDFYDDGDGIMLRKIYQPLNKEYKWRTNLTSLVVDGIKELPEQGELLIITKSRKDRLVLKHYGYNAISTNSESSFIPEEVFKKLKIRYTTIQLFFDSDKAGKINSDKLSIRHGISKIEIPNPWGVSDIAEFRDKHGDRLTKLILNKITI